jgi:hypothetical protein
LAPAFPGPCAEPPPPRAAPPQGLVGAQEGAVLRRATKGGALASVPWQILAAQRGGRFLQARPPTPRGLAAARRPSARRERAGHRTAARGPRGRRFRATTPTAPCRPCPPPIRC